MELSNKKEKKRKKKIKRNGLVPRLTLSQGAVKWLIFCILLVGFWHYDHVDLWVIPVMGALLGWKYWLVVKKQPDPSRRTTAVLFFLFPRPRGALWNLPQDTATQARSGFRDSVGPGQFAQLASSNVVAFRVTFPDGEPPPQRELYFRGLILWFTDGARWSQGVIPAVSYQQPRMGDNGIRHEIQLEPHHQHWAFGLDIPIQVPRGSRMMPGNIFQTWRTVKKAIHYQVTSTQNPIYPGELHYRYRRWALQMPDGGHQSIREYAQSLRDNSADDEAIVQAVLKYFRDNNFQYTLKPGTMDEDEPFDDFFFTKRRGFCEHFAGAFAMVMRAARIPTRIVLGYHGGEYNPVGRYLVVRQSDAHAWCEVWLDRKGWQRVDPTAAAAPGRVEYGMAMSQRLGVLGVGEGEGQAAADAGSGFFRKIFNFFRDHWDNIKYRWDVAIMTYDRYNQRSFLKSLGLSNPDTWNLLAILLAIIPTIYWLISFLLKRETVSVDPVGKTYRHFCRKTGKRGLRPHSWEGPLDFRERLLEGLPHRGDSINQITRFYIRLRYGSGVVEKESVKQFKRMVRRFRV